MKKLETQTKNKYVYKNNWSYFTPEFNRLFMRFIYIYLSPTECLEYISDHGFIWLIIYVVKLGTKIYVHIMFIQIFLI